MRRSLCFLTLALGASTGVAEDADPLKSPACIQALDALQAQEAALSASSGHDEGAGERRLEPALHAALQTLRRKAARDCLGSRLDAPPAIGRFAQPPLGVAPATPAPATRAVAPPAAAAVPPPIRMPPLLTVTACDPTGCWASDGTRLQRIGSALFGPPGLCTVQGAVLSCQ